MPLFGITYVTSFFLLVGRLNVLKLMFNVVGSREQITLSFIKIIQNYSKYSWFIVDKRLKQRKHSIDYFADWKIHKIWKSNAIHYRSGFEIWNRAVSSHVITTTKEWFVSICCIFWFVSVRQNVCALNEPVNPNLLFDIRNISILNRWIAVNFNVEQFDLLVVIFSMQRK